MTLTFLVTSCFSESTVAQRARDISGTNTPPASFLAGGEQEEFQATMDLVGDLVAERTVIAVAKKGDEWKMSDFITSPGDFDHCYVVLDRRRNRTLVCFATYCPVACGCARPFYLLGRRHGSRLSGRITAAMTNLATLIVLILLTGCAHHLEMRSQATVATTAATTGGTDYVDDIKAHIRNKWGYPCILHPTSGACEYKDAVVRLEFGITKDGEVGFVKVRDASGYPTYDDHAIEAIKSAAPFSPVPDSLSKTGITINATMRHQVVNPR